jgi:hypothetical protein
LAFVVQNLKIDTPMPQKALFIPLTGQWFDAFASGQKTVEYRRAGPRWNARTCVIGRRVVLSHGYSGARLTGVITSYAEVPCVKVALAIYPDAPTLAAIGIRLDIPKKRAAS